jgi:hypothetical protein
MPYIKKSPIQEKLWELAEKVPGAKYVLPDPYEATSYLMPVGGLTKQAVSKEIVGKLFNAESPVLMQGLRKDLSELLRVVAVTPKRAIAHVKEFRLIPGKTTGGSYHPEGLSVFSSDFPSTMAGTYAHEVGHGVSLPMAGKLRLRPGKAGSLVWRDPEDVGQILAQDPFLREHFEGVAEYLGKHLQEKAGIQPQVAFGYGGLQEHVFEQLEKMPSKNPYMNAYRYLQKLLSY